MGVRELYKFLFLCLVTSCLASSHDNQDDHVDTKVKRSARRNTQNGFLPGMVNMSSYTPAPLSPDEVQCQVGVNEIRYYDGRCIRLGNSQQTACQAGIHLDINNKECVRNGRRRSNGRNRGRNGGRNNQQRGNSNRRGG